MKTNVFQLMKSLAFASVLGVMALGSGNSFATSVNMYGVNFTALPGIVAPSLPAFGTYINANFTKGSSSSQLVVTQKSSTMVLVKPTSPYSYAISSGTYNLTANFNSSGAFTGGTVKITGKITSLGINTTATLMTANLTPGGFAKNSAGTLWGFNTNTIVCHSAVHAAVGCTVAESVYLGLASAQKSLTKSWKTTGVALTSVPVPAAAWLLGSGLIGMVAVARRKKA